MKKYPIVLTIAGSDSCGGAGIQADIKAISATGSYAASAITAVTVQNTAGVENVFPIPCDIISSQIEAVVKDLDVKSIKIGMIHSFEAMSAISSILMKFGNPNIVVDPVMIATSGHRLVKEDAVGHFINCLFPIARVVTPNLPEAEVLVGSIITNIEDMKEAAKKMSINGNVSVWLKGGHLEEQILTDIFYNAENDRFIELKTERVNTVNTHGTGCTLSSALASYLAQGLSLNDAVMSAKSYLDSAIRSGAEYKIGHGHGPVNHFWNSKI